MLILPNRQNGVYFKPRLDRRRGQVHNLLADPAMSNTHYDE